MCAYRPYVLRFIQDICLGIAEAFDDQVAYNDDLVQKCKVWFKV